MSEALRSRTPEELSPYEAVLRSFGYFGAGHGRRACRGAIRPGAGGAEGAGLCRCLGDAGLLCVQDYAQGFDLQADSLASGLDRRAARRRGGAIQSPGPFQPGPGALLPEGVPGFRNAAERAVALNPMDGNSIAFLGELLTYAGDRERGLALAGRAKQLNPNHPGWYWYADFYDAYRQGDDRGALDVALKVNLPATVFARGDWPPPTVSSGNGTRPARR